MRGAAEPAIFIRLGGPQAHDDSECHGEKSLFGGQRGRINFFWQEQKFLLHFFFVWSSIRDCRNEGEASVKATARWLFEVAGRTSHRLAKLNQEVDTEKALE